MLNLNADMCSELFQLIGTDDQFFCFNYVFEVKVPGYSKTTLVKVTARQKNFLFELDSSQKKFFIRSRAADITR